MYVVQKCDPISISPKAIGFCGFCSTILNRTLECHYDGVFWIGLDWRNNYRDQSLVVNRGMWVFINIIIKNVNLSLNWINTIQVLKYTDHTGFWFKIFRVRRGGMFGAFVITVSKTLPMVLVSPVQSPSPSRHHFHILFSSISVCFFVSTLAELPFKFKIQQILHLSIICEA